MQGSGTSGSTEMRDLPGDPVVKTSPSEAAGVDSIPRQWAKIPHASWPENQKIRQKQYCNKFNKDYKYGPHQKKKKKNSRESDFFTHIPARLSPPFSVFLFSFINSSVAQCLTWMQERHIWTMHSKLSVMRDLTIVSCFYLENCCLCSPPRLP